jgi:hypothetical protein
MRHSIPRDGIIAGALGATAVAVWFLIVDVLTRTAFYTPIGLGRGLLSVLGRGPHNDPAVAVVIAYTIFHFAAFIGVAMLAAVIVHWGRSTPGVLAGALVLFVCAELGFYLLAAVLAESPVFGTLSWVQVATGNLIAAIVMGVYLWRTHPEVAHGLDSALKGEDADLGDVAGQPELRAHR